MKYLLCPDKFKGSLTAVQVCDALRAGILNDDPPAAVEMIPMADGGDGSIGLLVGALGLHKVIVPAQDPLGRSIDAAYYKAGESAYIELAAASGLVLLDESERDPKKTSTFGTGLVIREAIRSGCKEINVFIGGSATNDAAMGIAVALGYQFLDGSGMPLDPIGGNLQLVESIHYDQEAGARDEAIFKVICDVDNPFSGKDGAAYVYAGQKGADKLGIQQLDKGLAHFAGQLIRDGYKDIRQVSGAGAAGGVGGGMMALCGAELTSGVRMFFDLFQLDDAIAKADIVITGEGKFDDQSFYGKVVGRICLACIEHAKPCHVVCGIQAVSSDVAAGIRPAAVHAIIDRANDMEDALNDAHRYLVAIGTQISRDARERGS